MDLRTSERSAFKRCPQRWEWGIKEQLSPRRVANPLWFGQAVHMALADWYQPGLKRGPHPAETFQAVLEGERIIRIPHHDEDQMAEYVDARELGIAMMQHYVDHYGLDEHKFYIGTEQSFQVWIPKLRSKVKHGIRYDGTFDGVFKNLKTGDIWLDEHKTAAGISLNHLPLDFQAGSYWAMAYTVLVNKGILERKQNIRGIEFNFMRKAARDSREQDHTGAYTNKPTKMHYFTKFEEEGFPMSSYRLLKLEGLKELAHRNHLQILGDVSKSQPPPYFERYPVIRSMSERRKQIEHIKKDAWHIEQARTNPDYPIMKNTTKDCSWDCSFFHMCQLDEQGDKESVEDMKATLYVTRDPYADHRKSA